MKNLIFILTALLITNLLNSQTTSLEIDANNTANFYQNVKIGLNYTESYPSLEILDNRYMCLNAHDLSTAGILFHESGTKSKGTVEYGARINYNDYTNTLIISTFDGSNGMYKSFEIKRAGGHIGILTAPSSTYVLNVNGSIQATSISLTSDSSLKSDIKTLKDEPAKIKDLRGVSYYRKKDIYGSNFNDSTILVMR